MRQRTAPRSRPSAAPQASGFWNALDDAERSALRTAARPRTYSTNMPLCNQGDRSDYVVIIEHGWVKVTSATENGHEVMLAVRGPGDLVCEGAVLGDRQRSATVAAMSPLRTLVIPAGRFTAFLDEFPRTWRMVSETVVHRLDDADRRVRAQASSTGAQRLALLLIELSELSQREDGRAGDGTLEIRPPLSQEELASWVDASRETVARALKVWRAHGLVRTERRKITILDAAGLRAYAQQGTPASDTG
ncbi:Crp/Fnr family transcriptional regulator [Actinomadura sp. HBU206391]|nr:Crp/Fnr family transcriptional regulator [Actinomadura sp. HBU206391]